MDRRDSPRTPWQAKLKIRDASSKRLVSEEACLRDLGRKGFALILGEALTQGKEYLCEINLSPNTVALKARVMHLHADGNYYYKCGMRIESASLVVVIT